MTVSISQRTDDLLARMTLDEKLAQLTSCWMQELLTDGALDPHKAAIRLQHGIGQVSRPGGRSTLAPQDVARVANRVQRFLIEQTRLGIPAILHEEACCGAMVLGGTTYPQPLGLASTFQPELAEQMALAIRRQLLAIGARQALAPVLDLARDPRWGRVEETFGEDPTLAAHLGMAYVRGLQGDDLSRGVMATGKHFVGHSASQGGLNCGPVHLGWHELNDLYLAPFQAAIAEAGLAAIMNAYPELDGEVVAASRRLLTDLLRSRLGFEGLVVSDYDAIPMIHNYHHVASDLRAAAVLALQAGIEVELPTSTCFGDPLRVALEAGDLDMQSVDAAVRRHLQKKYELGLFDHPYVDEARVLQAFEASQDRALAREIARRSLVLLKNDGLLPLGRSLRSLAVIGPNAHQGRNLLGDYSYAAICELIPKESGPTSREWIEANSPHVTTVLDGVRALVAREARVQYAPGCGNLDPDARGIAEAVRLAREAEAVVLALGDRSGMLPDCTCGETRDSASLRLPGAQHELARAILDTGRPVAIVLITGRPYAIPDLASRANAILQAWLPGQEGGMAIAEVLFGDFNPGGRLPITFPRSVGQVPISYNHKPSAMRSNWYVDYVDETVRPLYPFGHGLSYTTFAYENLEVSPPKASLGESIDIGADITNTGDRPGEEVVQLYTRDEFASLPRPVKELRGYLRLALEPGERKRVIFHLPVNQLAVHDQELCLGIEAGRIQVMVGSSSEDIRLQGEFEILGQGKVAIPRRVFVCPVDAV
jgi:beta-glucosidase